MGEVPARRLTLDDWQPALACGLITLAAAGLEIWFVPRMVRAFLDGWARHGAEPVTIGAYAFLAAGCVAMVVQPALATVRYLRPDPRGTGQLPDPEGPDREPSGAPDAAPVAGGRGRGVAGLLAVIAAVVVVSVCAWTAGGTPDRDQGPPACDLVYMGACVN